MANKKINQLVSKTSILGTDLFPLGDGTTGQLFKKTVAELQAAIGGAVISVNGLVGTVVLDTDDIQELATPTNRYFTEARTRGAISLLVAGNSGASTYNSSTGVINVPTYTLAGLGGITASFLSGSSGIAYNSSTGVITYTGTVFTDASIRSLFSGGTGITYNSSTGAISYSGTVYTDSSVRALFSGSTGITYNSSTGAISTTITQYTDALARASISLTTTGTSGASTYNSTTGVLNIPQYQAVITNPVTGTGTTNFVTKWTSSSAVGNSQIFDNGTNVGIGTNTPTALLHVKGGNNNSMIVDNDGSQYTPIYISNNGSIKAFAVWDNTALSYQLGTAVASSNLQLITNNIERMRITASGNVGIGTSNPIYRFQVLPTPGASAFDGLNVTTGSTDVIGLYRTGSSYSFGMVGANQSWMYSNFGDLNIMTDAASASIKFGTQNGTERMRITSSGNVGIGTSTPENNANNYRYLHIQGSASTTGGVLFLSSSGGANSSQIYNNSDGLNINTNTSLPIIFNPAGADQGRITSGGNWLLGTSTNNGERLYVSGNIRATGTITANSDITLKKNLAKIENALEKVEQINGYTYEFKADDSKRHAGVIAQEIEGVLPEIVNKGADGILGVEYGNISALLIEAIKEQQTQINELKALLNK